MQKMVTNKIFQMFFLSLSIILLLSILILLNIYHIASKNLEQELYQSTYEVLDHCANSMEYAVKQAEETISSFAFHDSFHEFVSEDSYHASRQLYKAKKVYEILSSNKDLFQYNGILDVIVYAAKSDTVVSFQVPYSPALYYRHILELPGKEQALHDLLSSPMKQTFPLTALEVKFYGKTYSVLPIVLPMMIRKGPSELGTVTVLLDIDQNNWILNPLKLGETGAVYMVNNLDGSYLSFANPQKQVPEPGEEQFPQKDFLHIQIDMTAARSYHAYIPRQLVYSPIYHIRQSILLLMSIEIALGFLLIATLAYRQTKPLTGIFSILASKGLEGSNDYTSLQGGVTALVSDNEYLTQQLQKQTPILQSDILRNYLYGTSFTANEEKIALEYLNCQTDGKAYIILLVKNLAFEEYNRRHNLKEPQNINLLIKEAFAQSDVFTADSFQRSLNEVVFLLSFSQQNMDYCEGCLREHISNLESLLQLSVDIPLMYLASNFFFEVKDAARIYRSFENLVLTNQYTRLVGKLIFLSEVHTFHTAYYPIEEERRLIRGVLLGNMEAVSKILDEIYRVNRERKLSEEGFFALYQRLTITIMRIIESYPNTVFYEEYTYLQTEITLANSDAILNKVESILLELTRIISLQQADDQNKSKQEYLQYTHDNLSVSTFNLHNIAQHFGYSESAFYRIFRENVGYTFSSVLERMRIETACERLKNQEEPIHLIAQAVGYNSAHAFRRAFYKFTGVLPSDYRCKQVEKQTK